MLKDLISTLLSIILTMIIVTGCAITGPKLYRQTLRDYVGSRVIRIQTYTEKGGISGGTGFYVKAPSGKTYILTNRHVCQLEKGEMLRVLNRDGYPIPTKVEVIEMSKTSDLCLINPIHKIEGLTVADDVKIGSTIHYVGFPRLQPLTMTSGEMVGYEVKTISLGEIGKDISKESCGYGKDMKIIKVPAKYFDDDEDEDSVEWMQKDDGFPNKVQKFKYGCFETGNSLVSTLMIYGGASGSPTVDGFGEVVGVVYAAPRIGGWGWSVPLSDIRAILKGR